MDRIDLLVKGLYGFYACQQECSGDTGEFVRLGEHLNL